MEPGSQLTVALNRNKLNYRSARKLKHKCTHKKKIKIKKREREEKKCYFCYEGSLKIIFIYEYKISRLGKVTEFNRRLIYR